MKANQLTGIKIKGLHGRWDVDIPIRDNKLILVGENGKSKSTVVNLLYFALTAQSDRLQNVHYDSLTLTVGGKNKSIPRLGTKDLANEFELSRALSKPEYTRFLRFIEQKQLDLFAPKDKWPLEFSPKLLFLPTYRRIEQDLTDLLGGDTTLAKTLTDKLNERSSHERYTELIQFGMRDVAELIETRLNAFKEAFRNGQNELTGSYFKDLIRGKHTETKPDAIKSLTEEETKRVLMRIDEKTLPGKDKKSLKRLITKVKESGQVAEADRHVAYFLTELIKFYRKQDALEEDMQAFQEIVNGYLQDKQLNYDNIAYRLTIRDNTEKHDRLDFSVLSSGEKQIISLFAHLLLSEEKQHFLIIDEPELSLSVPWQRKLLPDVMATGRCAGLVAVTHSPFVYDNHLEAYTHSMSEFMEPAL